MAQSNKIHLPSSGGGLVRYYDDYKSKIRISPYVVLVFIFLIIIFEILLYKGVL